METKHCHLGSRRLSYSAAMSDNANKENSPNIAAKSLGCLTAFRRLYFLLLTNQSPRAGDIVLSKVSNVYSRLKVWGTDSGAICTGRGSLDDRLRTDNSLRLIILDLLCNLEEVLEMGMTSTNPGYMSVNDQRLTEGSDSLRSRHPCDKHGPNTTVEESDQDSLSSTRTGSKNSIDSSSGSRLAKTDT